MTFSKAILKEQLSHLPHHELIEMLLKLSGKRYNYEYLLVNFLDPIGGEQTLFEEAKEDIMTLQQKDFKGRTLQPQLTKKIKACAKRIDEFCVETKSKKLEADLLDLVLRIQFEKYLDAFGENYSGYDYRVGLMLKRLINIVTKKLHPDYYVDYEDSINEYLNCLHKSSDRIKTIKNLSFGQE